MAVGWLGWVPDVVLATPIPMIELSLKGKVDFIKKTNPFGSGEDPPKASDLSKEPPNPAFAARQLMGFFGRLKKDQP
jgi:hypothetical protein